MTTHPLVFVAGHRGLIGSAVLRTLAAHGRMRALVRERSELDLADPWATRRFFLAHRPEYVVLAAGRSGGILENLRHPADLLHDNLAIQTSVLRAAQESGVRRLVFYASSCMYPRDADQPMDESALLTGRPEPSSLPYACAKLAGVQACLAWNRQIGEPRFLPLIPNSVYGPGDDFDADSTHVLAALIRRFSEAAATGAARVTLWGSGAPQREFVYADDVAEATLALLEGEIAGLELPLNIASGEEITIRELAQKIATLAGYHGEILWDRGKPDGAPRKLLDGRRLAQWGWTARVTLADGLRRTLDWYRAQPTPKLPGTDTDA